MGRSSIFAAVRQGSLMDLQNDLFILEGRQVEALTLGIGVAGAIVVILHWGAFAGVSFALGAALSLMSFAWLKRGVVAVGDVKAAEDARNRIPGGVLIRFWGRYIFVAAVVYVILARFKLPAIALFAGLFASTAGVLIAAIWHVVRSGEGS
jgi:ATP synthase I chain